MRPLVTVAACVAVLLFFGFNVAATFGAETANAAVAHARASVAASAVLVIAVATLVGGHSWYEKIFTPRQAAAIIAAWVAYGSVFFLPIDPGNVFSGRELAPGLVALWLFAMSLVPFVTVMATISALHLMRHRR